MCLESFNNDSILFYIINETFKKIQTIYFSEIWEKCTTNNMAASKARDKAIITDYAGKVIYDAIAIQLIRSIQPFIYGLANRTQVSTFIH